MFPKRKRHLPNKKHLVDLRNNNNNNNNNNKNNNSNDNDNDNNVKTYVAYSILRDSRREMMKADLPWYYLELWKKEEKETKRLNFE